MNKDKREYDYPVELESQLIMRLPEEPAKALRDLLRSGENFKNRLTIQLENDMRYGEVRFDHWLLHVKIVDLPTIIESLKTIDKKNTYKTADICQLMICKEEKEPASTEEESPTKNKKKDSLKVDKKFLWPHGITPPTKNVRRRRFRKTLKKKNAEAPDIEKEVKRLLRADIEAVSSTWEVIQEDNDHNVKSESSIPIQTEKVNMKKERNYKADTTILNPSSSKVEDIFGGAVSDSDIEDDLENVNVDIDDSRLSSYIENIDLNTISSAEELKGNSLVTQFRSEMFHSPQTKSNICDPSTSFSVSSQYYQQSNKNDIKLQQLSAELEELKQRKQRTQLEISGMENVTLRQRFKDILHTINQEITIKEIELKNVQSHY